MKEALIVIDYQYDFVNPNGSLYIKGAETLQSYINSLIEQFKSENKIVIATRDWHPENHYSFEKWGPHCIQDSEGSKLLIDYLKIDFLVSKGMDENIESYSAFYDEKGVSNGLHEYLQKYEIDSLLIVGVATDVCVAATINEAIKLGYKTTLDLDGSIGITNKITFN